MQRHVLGPTVRAQGCVLLCIPMVLGTAQLQTQSGPLCATAELIINNKPNIDAEVMLQKRG